MKYLSNQDVESLLEVVRNSAGDEEIAHAHEDILHQTVLRAIADGKCEDPKEAARIAMKSREIKFSRWYS